MRNERVLYFDTNVFRRIIRDLLHWQRLEEFFVGMVFPLDIDDDGTIKHAYRNLPRATCGIL